jgi:glycosyltransferase involved in cell wall biosynthesis
MQWMNMKTKIVVVSPGVLPLPPVLGGAVENLIWRLHPHLADHFEMHYLSVAIPDGRADHSFSTEGAILHTTPSINPLKDFSESNSFELSESSRWPAYYQFCTDVIANTEPGIVHIHNEALLAIQLGQSNPPYKIILHINDEVVTRLDANELAVLANTCDLVLSCSKLVQSNVAKAFKEHSIDIPRTGLFYNFTDTHEFDPNCFGDEQCTATRQSFGLDERPIVLFPGRIIEQKGPHLLLEAFKRARSQGGNAQLLFVGAPWYSHSNESKFVQRMMEQSATLENDIFFTGYIPHERMPTIYAIADPVVTDRHAVNVRRQVF